LFKNKNWGIVAEEHGYTDKERLRSMLEWKIQQMAKLRRLKFGPISYRIESLRIPWYNNGCVLSTLVFMDKIKNKSEPTKR
ncbi:MAG: hypothetical protein ABIH76_00055, partial [Candidatus Bathyarchaeota archaeon]